jgi:hypothetical protein
MPLLAVESVSILQVPIIISQPGEKDSHCEFRCRKEFLLKKGNYTCERL